MSKKHDKKLEFLNLSDLVIQFLESFSRIIPEYISVKTILLSSPGIIFADKHQIEQIFLNLFLNSKEFIEKKGEIEILLLRLSIKEFFEYGYRKTEPGEYIEICIADTGKGIAKENLNNVFEPFWTTKERVVQV